MTCAYDLRCFGQAKIQNVYITTGYGWDQSDMSVM